MKILEVIKERYSFLEKQDLPTTFVPSEDLFIQIKKMEASLNKKVYFIKNAYELIGDVDSELERWNNRYSQLTLYSRELSKKEAKLDAAVVGIRRKRKVAAIDASMKKQLGDVLREAIPGLLGFLKDYQSAPPAVSIIGSSNDVAKGAIGIIEEMKKKLDLAPKEPKKIKKEEKKEDIEEIETPQNAK